MHHAVICNYLDHYAPGWEMSTRHDTIKQTLFVTCTITIHGLDEAGNRVSQTREDTGNEKDEMSSKEYGDSYSNAFAQALRRAAMRHGLGRHLWLGK